MRVQSISNYQTQKQQAFGAYLGSGMTRELPDFLTTSVGETEALKLLNSKRARTTFARGIRAIKLRNANGEKIHPMVDLAYHGKKQGYRLKIRLEGTGLTYGVVIKPKRTRGKSNPLRNILTKARECAKKFQQKRMPLVGQSQKATTLREGAISLAEKVYS